MDSSHSSQRAQLLGFCCLCLFSLSQVGTAPLMASHANKIAFGGDLIFHNLVHHHWKVYQMRYRIEFK